MNATVVWFIIGALLMLAELFTPTFILVFLGIGAWGAAAAAAVFPGIEQELAAFIIVSLFSLFFLRRRMMNTFQGRKFAHKQNSPDFPHAGRQALVTKTISPASEGEISFGGSFWRATSLSEIPAGATVKVLKPTEDDDLLLWVELVSAV